MISTRMKRTYPFFRYLSTFVLLVALVLNSIPFSTALASAPNVPLFIPGADTSLSIDPLERVMVGEDFELYVSFDNSAETGFGPFIDLVFPTNGADGAAGTDTPDGINFVSGEYDGYTLPSTSLVFPDDDGPLGPGTTGCVAHPLAVDATGTAAQVCGTTGDTLVVLELPFSSVTIDMPMIYAEVVAHVSELADVDTPLTILGRGGYRFGADNLNNPAEDPAILTPPSTDGSGWPSLQVTPRVIHIEKGFNGPMECPYTGPQVPTIETTCYGEVKPVYETVSGPNFPRQYNINIYVAAGQTITDLDVTDIFDNNVAFLSVISLGGGTLLDSPTVGMAANAPDNDLIVNFASLTGSTDIVAEFFIPEFDADGNPVLDPLTGDPATAENIATALGDWTPIDARDPSGPDNAIANGDGLPLHTLDIRSLAVQKSVEIIDDTGAPGYSPGDALEYTLDFQISDYFGFGNMVLTDVLTDGQRFSDLGGDFRPNFSVSDRNTTITEQDFTYTYGPAGTDQLSIDESQIGNTGVPADGTDGSTTLIFDISRVMTDLGAVDGVLEGGEAGYDISIGPTTPAAGQVPATGTITFAAILQEDFSDSYPSNDSSVDHGDVLFNAVEIEGTIANEDATLTATTQENDSIQKVKIVYGGFEKDIYAINGSTSFTPEVQPGDTLTFRLRQDLPSSDSDTLVLTDFLPLPIIDAAEIVTFDDVTDATVPLAGYAKFGPDSTLNAALASPVLPTISADTANNSLSFDFGSFDDAADTTTVLDILFTLTVSNAPYLDGAVLTNLAFAEEGTTNNGELFHGDGVRFTLKEPGISVSKGVVASDNPAAVFVPDPPAPVTFSAPGADPSWSGLIASGDNDPGTALINSDVQDVVSGDLLTFAIVVENLGHSSLGAFDVSVQDTLPAELEIPAGGLNLQVWRGDGAPIIFSPVGGTATDPSGLFDDGIVLDDESPTQGIAHVYDAANGENLIVITYDLQIAADLAGGSAIVNTATLLSYAGTEGGPNHVGATPTNNVHSDDATVTLPNVAPVITEGANINVTMSEDASPISFALTLHATDANGDPLSWSISSPATYGTAGVGAGTGVVSYAPFENYNGPDSFVVQVSDGVFTDSITVNLTVQSVLDITNMIWNQSYDIQYDGWVGFEDPSALDFQIGYRKAKSGTFTFKHPTAQISKFEWITYRGPDQGIARVYVDGVLKKTVDLYSPTPEWRYSVEIKGLALRKHTVVVRATNTRNPASGDNWVVVDGFRIGKIFHDGRIGSSGMYSYGSWLGLRATGPRFGAYRLSSTKDATIQFAFAGTRFNWVTARGPAYGKAQVYVDGQLVRTVDLYRSAQQWRYRVAIDGLTYGNHVVEIRVLHMKNSRSSGFGVVADGFEID